MTKNSKPAKTCLQLCLSPGTCLGELDTCHHLVDRYHFISGMLLLSQMGTKSFLIASWKTDSHFVFVFFNSLKQYFSMNVCWNLWKDKFSLIMYCMMFHTIIYPFNVGSGFQFLTIFFFINVSRDFLMTVRGLRISLPKIVPICFQWMKNLHSKMRHVTPGESSLPAQIF